MSDEFNDLKVGDRVRVLEEVYDETGGYWLRVGEMGRVDHFVHMGGVPVVMIWFDGYEQFDIPVWLKPELLERVEG